MPSNRLLKKDGLYFIPLGGSEQFGINLNIYVCNGQFLAVDCGMGFADERFPGIDIVLPDPAFLEQNKKKLKGMIITHAHEDHIGAVSHLWPRFECPLYATPFTAVVLRKKLEEAGIYDAKINVVDPLMKVQIGTFGVQFIPVSHSVPDSCALMIRTEHGNILHSGDWNLDPNPVVGLKTEDKTFKTLGEEGIVAYIGDSTNALVPGFSGSERDASKGLYEEFKNRKGRIAVTLFSSNIGRMVSIAEAAHKTGRHVTVVGRSLHRMVAAAQECGYLRNIKEFVSEEDIGFLPDEKTVLIVTGSQGEYRSALARIARDEHPSVHLSKGDTVIFSARAIPGNERNINAVKNNLVAKGIHIISPGETDNTIHVSGHPCRGEIEQMLQWTRPACVIPVHGERLQLEAHAGLAQACQVPQTVVPSNGSLIRLAPGPVEEIAKVETGLLAVDQDRLIPSGDPSIIARRKLQYTGAVHASLLLSSGGEILGDICMDMIGLTDGRNPGKLEEDIFAEIEEIVADIAEGPHLEEEAVAEEVRICLRRFLHNRLGIKPKTTVHVLRVPEGRGQKK
ncbi:MAG: ribonuclease J [Alphaproteobacteria bacterium]|nr:ribonuclease J [Alphaproteobacteria bacterium]MBP7757773.1 ribonuclease J [Alphaproteobacteria bacterium]MBP7761027.1 ribonuclease J [Alphaproteobacteria bacterium]